jgi:hypothetical protein
MKDIWIQFVSLDCEMRFVHKDAPFLLQLYGTYSYIATVLTGQGLHGSIRCMECILSLGDV